MLTPNDVCQKLGVTREQLRDGLLSGTITRAQLFKLNNFGRHSYFKLLEDLNLAETIVYAEI
jgi:hypothetical protein